MGGWEYIILNIFSKVVYFIFFTPNITLNGRVRILLLSISHRYHVFGNFGSIPIQVIGLVIMRVFFLNDIRR